MTKRSLFAAIVRGVRFFSGVFQSVLSLVVRRDEIDPRFTPKYPHKEIWNTEYRTWDKHKQQLLRKAIPRLCPACGVNDADHLWNTEDGYTYVQCRACRFVYVTPYLTNKLRETFEKDRRRVSRDVIDARVTRESLEDDRARFSFYLDALGKFKRGGSILDIGCLTGNFLFFARERGYAPFGIEYRPYAIEVAKRTFRLDIREGFFEDRADTMVKEQQRFDVISLWETLEHMLHPDAVIKNAHRLLTPDGIIAITVPNFDNLQVKILRERCFHCLGGPGPAGHINMFTPFSLTAMLEKNGFRVQRIETEGSSSYFDLLAFMSARYDRINSYGNAVRPATAVASKEPYFLPPALMNSILALSPVWNVLENAMMKGAVILAIARKKT